METIEKLLNLARKKNTIDSRHDWSHGSCTYFSELKKELLEVEEELPLGRKCYLEDELGDVLWDYLNALVCLEEEKGINIESVFNRAVQKYQERIAGIENGVSWKKTKEKQNSRMLVEYETDINNANT